MASNRRDFLKKIGVVGAGAGLMPVQAFANNHNELSQNKVTSNVDKDGKFTVSILQTTDVHCQIHPHDELFWENEKAVFRKTGGYAHLATYLKDAKAKAAENTFILDTGDMFQGSELSVSTLGKAMVPILKHVS